MPTVARRYDSTQKLNDQHCGYVEAVRNDQYGGRQTTPGCCCVFG